MGLKILLRPILRNSQTFCSHFLRIPGTRECIGYATALISFPFWGGPRRLGICSHFASLSFLGGRRDGRGYVANTIPFPFFVAPEKAGCCSSFDLFIYLFGFLGGPPVCEKWCD